MPNGLTQEAHYPLVYFSINRDGNGGIIRRLRFNIQPLLRWRRFASEVGDQLAEHDQLIKESNEKFEDVKQELRMIREFLIQHFKSE